MGLYPVEVLNFFFWGGGVNLLLLNLKLPLGRSYPHLNLYFHRSHHLYESYEGLTEFVNHDLFNQEYNNITDQIGWHKVLLPIIKTTCITKLIVKVKNDHRSKFSSLSNWKEEAWKNQGFNRIRTRDLRVTRALL